MLDSVYLHQLVIDQSSFYPVAGKMDQSQLNTTQDLYHLDRARSQPNKNLRFVVWLNLIRPNCMTYLTITIKIVSSGNKLGCITAKKRCYSTNRKMFYTALSVKEKKTRHLYYQHNIDTHFQVSNCKMCSSIFTSALLFPNWSV